MQEADNLLEKEKYTAAMEIYAKVLEAAAGILRLILNREEPPYGAALSFTMFASSLDMKTVPKP